MLVKHVVQVLLLVQLLLMLLMQLLNVHMDITWQPILHV